MDAAGNMPGEAGYNRFRKAMTASPRHIGEEEATEHEETEEGELVTVGTEERATSASRSHSGSSITKASAPRPFGLERLRRNAVRTFPF